MFKQDNVGAQEHASETKGQDKPSFWGQTCRDLTAVIDEVVSTVSILKVNIMKVLPFLVNNTAGESAQTGMNPGK
jgi:hypothetical protein